MTAPAAWFCPACWAHHAPHVETCPAPEVKRVGKGPDITAPIPPIAPWYTWPPSYDPLDCQTTPTGPFGFGPNWST